MASETNLDKDSGVKCPTCTKLYSSQDSLRKHLSQGRCKGVTKIVAPAPASDVMTMVLSLNDTLLSMKAELSELKKRPIANVTNNNDNRNLNVICLREKEDLLDLLMIQEKSSKKALTFVKNCALARLAGDCRILQRIYFPVGEKPAITYANKSKTQFVYYDENNNRIVEKNWQVIAKKMVDNLQRCYLRGSCSFKDEDNRFMRVKEDHVLLPQLDESDLALWNEHAYGLQDEKHQKKIFSNLPIQYESEFL